MRTRFVTKFRLWVSHRPNPIVTTFRGGILNKVVGVRDCAKVGCHDADLGSPAGQLALGQTSLSQDQIYTLLITSGGTSQRGGGDKDVNTVDPAASLLCSKPDSDEPGVSHAGGKLYGKAADEYKICLGWVQDGAKNN